MATSASATTTGDGAAWDREVVEELAGFKYVRVVLFTDGFGSLLAQNGRAGAGPELAARVDMTIAGLEHAGQALAMGDLAISLTTFEDGTLVTAATPDGRATVLADAGANLGQLLSYMRRVFPGAHD